MSVWNTLAAIDCNEHVESKGGFSYLAWTWAWAMVKDKYPLATYELLEDTVYPDGTVEVRVRVFIEDLSHTMWLPVLDFRNKAIPNPNAFDVNSSRMRCLVKCLAMFGLGHYIYAGESAPPAPSFTQAQKDEYTKLIAEGNGFALKKFANEVGSEVLTALFNDAPKGQVTKQKDKYRKVVNEANAQLKATLEALEEAVAKASEYEVAEIMGELTGIEARFVREGMDEVLTHQVDSLLEEVA